MTTRRILICDDELDIQDLLLFICQQEGLSGCTAVDPSDLVEQARMHATAAILLDMRLRDHDGLDLLIQLKADPMTAAIPVVMLSGVGEGEEKQLAMQNGAHTFINKPFSVDHLCEVLHRIIGGPGPLTSA